MFLVVLVCIETIARKLFNVSIQGADELGGYALAVGSTLSFSLAVIGRNHIRVDVLHERLSSTSQAFMNWLSIAGLATFAVFLTWTASKVIEDTIAYGSTAQTPWATPLVYPQGVWLSGLAIFSIVSIAYVIWATKLLLARKFQNMNHEFQPKSAKEELKEELDDIALRGAHQSGAQS